MTFDELYRKHYSQMLFVAKQTVFDKQDAPEAVNDSFIKAFNNIEKFNSGKGSFVNWLWTIVVNTSKDYNRRVKNNVRPLLNYESGKCYNDASFNMIGCLSPMQSKVVKLHCIEGYDHRETAELLNIGIGTTKRYLSDARKKMKRIL